MPSFNLQHFSQAFWPITYNLYLTILHDNPGRECDLSQNCRPERIWSLGGGIECNWCGKWAGLYRSEIIGPVETDKAGRLSVTK